MKNKEVIHSFLTGKLALLLEEKIGRRIKESNGGYFEPKSFLFSKVKIKNGYYYTDSEEDHYFLFAYLPRYNTKKYSSMPKYHIYTCESKEKYQGYKFSNKMPVDIYSKDENKTYSNQHLKLCRNCQKEVNHSIWGLFSDLQWFDVILKKANETEFTGKDLKRDGYVRLWKQISEAYREKMNFVCEECGINLTNDRYFLEVHHNDKNRLNNNEDNLKCLCVKCHSKKRHQIFKGDLIC